MVFAKSIAAAAVIGSLVAGVSAGSKTNIAVYWGQGDDQDRLSTFCDETSLDYIPIGFVDRFPEQGNGWPGTNFANQCSGAVYEGFGYDGNPSDPTKDHLLKPCLYIPSDIQYCRSIGKKILLSVGGGLETYGLNGASDGFDLGNFLWLMFGPKDPAWDGPRPFDQVADEVNSIPEIINSVDGWDFDIEFKPTDGSAGYIAAVNQLRANFPKESGYIVTGAPQCSVLDKNMDDVIFHAQFDIIWVQFYNSAGCSARDWADKNLDYLTAGVEDKTSGFSYDAWVEKIQNPASASKDAQIYIGVPGSEHGSAIDGFYLFPNEIEALIDAYYCHPTFGGVMIWEATSARKNDNYYDKVKSYLIDAEEKGCGSATTTTSATSTSTSTSISIPLGTGSTTSLSSTSSGPYNNGTTSTISSTSSVQYNNGTTSTTGTTSSTSSTSTSISIPLGTGSSSSSSSSSSSQPTLTSSITAPYGNHSITSTTSKTTLTSTICDTTTYTNSYGSVVTETRTRFTTWCPGETTPAPKPKPTETHNPKPAYTTLTVYTTITYTVTACPKTVPYCPATEKQTYVTSITKFLYTTVCPVEEASTLIPAKPIPTYPAAVVVPKPSYVHVPEEYTTLHSTTKVYVTVTLPSVESTPAVVVETHIVIPTPVYTPVAPVYTPVAPVYTPVVPVGTGSPSGSGVYYPEKPTGVPVYTGGAGNVRSNVLVALVAGAAAMLVLL